MDVLAELESIARGADYEELSSDHTELEAIHHYMDLFGLNEHEARTKLSELRDLVPTDNQQSKSKVKLKPRRAAAYLVMLQEQLPDAETIRAIAGLTEAPEVVFGTDDLGRQASFCRINSHTQSAIVTYVKDNHLGNVPTFFQLTQAEKALDKNSLAPMLGVDATLPQNRADSQHVIFRPEQEEYPVWYFFYGPLADPAELSIILRLSDKPQYKSATVSGGRLLSWNAVADSAPNEMSTDIKGQAFLVTTKRDEESLRFSVTDKFEVVRCSIRIDDIGELVSGLTFRYVGGDLF